MHAPQAVRRALITGSLCLSSVALASGLTFGDNGARALGQGGAFTAQADDPSAIQYNPAGLSQLSGTHLLFDGAELNHDVTFLRKDPGQDQTLAHEVHNGAGPFFLPMLAGGYGTKLGEFPFFFGAGVYGPPAVGRYSWPSPNYARDAAGKYVEDPRKFAPQRYGQIHSDNLIAFPTLAIAAEVAPRFSLGISLQYVYASLDFRQAVTSSLSTPKSQLDESAEFDSVVGVNQTAGSYTAVLGARYQATDHLTFGLSYRPSVPLHAHGKLNIELGEFAKAAGAKVAGDTADLDLALPQILRGAVHVQATRAIGVDGEVDYEGWQSNQQFVLTPKDMTIAIGSAPAQPLAPIHIHNNWHHTFSGRLGGSYAFENRAAVRLGILYEQQASPDEFLGIGFFHLARTFLTAGAEYPLGPVTVVLAGAFLPTQEKDITTSQVRQANTDPTIQGDIIADGHYTNSGWIASLGIHGHFGGSPEGQHR